MAGYRHEQMLRVEDMVSWTRFVSLMACVQGLMVLLLATYELLREYRIDRKFICLKVISK